MKNKEIEELLKELKDVAKRHTIEVREYGVVETIPSSISKELRLNSYSANLLLSYIEQLENKYDKALETLVDFNMPCERDDFNLLDTDYCEINCSVDDEQYEKCWDRWIEWRLENE